MIATIKSENVRPWKSEVVDELMKLIEHYPIVGVLDISDLPAAQFQQIRQNLRGKAEIVVSKNTLVSIAIKESAKLKDKKIEELLLSLKGQTGIIFTEMDPFKLSKFLRDNKINAPAKPGSISPKDILIPAGETDFAPGPVVAELQRIGIKARIQGGKVVILDDHHLLKIGDTISKEVSEALAKFGIMPMELGLKLHAAYEAGMVFIGTVLEIDEKKVLDDIQFASASAINLSLNVNYPTTLTIGVMIVKANVVAQNLALDASLPVAQIMPSLLARANDEMIGLAAVAGNKNPDVLDAELKDMLGIKPLKTEPKEKPAEKVEQPVEKVEQPVEEKPKEQ